LNGWNLIFGLGIFLYGMAGLESGLRQLGSQRLRQFFRQSTGNRWLAVLVGTLVTAFLQSSSMVSLMMQALAAAGLVPLTNAIGVILGANLGTTFTGWLVTLLGFKLDLDALSLPLIGLGSLGLVFGERRQLLRASSQLLLGLGLLLFGLNLMKGAVEHLPELLPIDSLSGHSPWLYLLLGVLMTAVIQSSSASMMIALTALNSGLIELQAAAALIIGADLGTTSTSALGSLRGSVVKKQLALAHFTFNLCVDLLAFLLLLPLLPWLLNWIGVSDPLYSLVTFHSLFNLIGLLLFMPVLGSFSRWIESCLQSSKSDDYPNLREVAALPDAALVAIERSVALLLRDVHDLNGRALPIHHEQNELSEEAFEQRYEALKNIEGEVLLLSRRMQTHSLTPEQSERLGNLVSAAREGVFSAKSIKDIRENLLRLTPGELGNFPSPQGRTQAAMYRQFNHLLGQQHSSSYARETLENIAAENNRLHEAIHEQILQREGHHLLNSADLSTLLNINRELWQAADRLRCALEQFYDLEDRQSLLTDPARV
jgi:phosphate:Na+ symporter